MYYVEKRVALSEVGMDYGMKLTQILDDFQDVCIMQSEDMNVGVKKLRDKGMCWVLSSWQVVVRRFPRLDEKILVGTAPYSFKGFMGCRNFEIKTPEGELLVYANSIWSFVDTEKMNLIRIPQYVMDAYVMEEKIDMDYAPRKIKLPEEMRPLEEVKVAYHNVDVNGHVNNAQYISIAEDLVPRGRRAMQMRAEYRASAKDGDVIYPYLNEDKEKGIYTVALSDEKGAPYVIVEFTERTETAK